ncbi:hypothetical protein M9H77_17101 [Catharanthus roseus]|uniref:Uncharacterized protein n=1 Tax=Catharanthus roseus TaxID=4058 RepID=A0ACC0B3M4_CATRO|nr:hypothetical protein M9H77_17101 [Catharanthus roseus]
MAQLSDVAHAPFPESRPWRLDMDVGYRRILFGQSIRGIDIGHEAICMVDKLVTESTFSASIDVGFSTTCSASVRCAITVNIQEGFFITFWHISRCSGVTNSLVTTSKALTVSPSLSCYASVVGKSSDPKCFLNVSRWSSGLMWNDLQEHKNFIQVVRERTNKTSITSRKEKVPLIGLEIVKLLATLDILNPRPQEALETSLAQFDPCDSLVIFPWLLSQLLDVLACLTGSNHGSTTFSSVSSARTIIKFSMYLNGQSTTMKAGFEAGSRTSTWETRIVVRGDVLSGVSTLVARGVILFAGDEFSYLDASQRIKHGRRPSYWIATMSGMTFNNLERIFYFTENMSKNGKVDYKFMMKIKTDYEFVCAIVQFPIRITLTNAAGKHWSVGPSTFNYNITVVWNSLLEKRDQLVQAHDEEDDAGSGATDRIWQKCKKDGNDDGETSGAKDKQRKEFNQETRDYNMQQNHVCELALWTKDQVSDNRNWSDLDYDPLSNIFKGLTIADKMHFQSIFSPWGFLAKAEISSLLRASIAKLSLLLLPEDEDYDPVEEEEGSIEVDSMVGLIREIHH